MQRILTEFGVVNWRKRDRMRNLITRKVIPTDWLDRELVVDGLATSAEQKTVDTLEEGEKQNRKTKGEDDDCGKESIGRRGAVWARDRTG